MDVGTCRSTRFNDATKQRLDRGAIVHRLNRVVDGQQAPVIVEMPIRRVIQPRIDQAQDDEAGGRGSVRRIALFERSSLGEKRQVSQLVLRIGHSSSERTSSMPV